MQLFPSVSIVHPVVPSRKSLFILTTTAMKIFLGALLISLVKESSVASFKLIPSRDTSNRLKQDDNFLAHRWLKKGTMAAVGAAFMVLTNPSTGNADAKPVNIEKISTELSENDIWRDTSLRYMGYANEVGESFGVLFPRYIEPSYGVAYGYVCGDALDKVYKSYKQGDEPLVIAKKGADALTWQTLASVVIPGKIINIVANGANGTLNTAMASSLPEPVKKWGATTIGLATIPFIITPIDKFVDLLLDNTLRMLW